MGAARFRVAPAVLAGALGVVACSDEGTRGNPAGDASSDGSIASGGSGSGNGGATQGSGGAATSGGTSASSGGASPGTGGMDGSAQGTGGASSTGDAQATGGSASTGGAPATGGATNTGDAGPDASVDSSLDGGGLPDGAPAHGYATRPANATCIAPDRPVSTTGVAVVQAFPGLDLPNAIALQQPPGDTSRWFVAQRNGLVKRFANDSTATTAATVLDIIARVNSTPPEAGLLGMAIDPGFAQNGQVYLSYTTYGTSTNLTSRISRFTSKDGGLTLDPSSEEILLTLDQPFDNHNGGNIAFGPDGYLYIGFGDGGSGGDPYDHGQDTTVLFGKILRIDVHGAAPYGIPATNPFAESTGPERKEIYAYGLRNPWRFSFDRGTGELWAGDVGQNVWEEVDRVDLGGNYGWRYREGAHCYNPSTNCPTSGLVDPIVEYDHSLGSCIIGGYVYRGSRIPSLVGSYVYTDLSSGRLWAVVYDAVTGAPQAKQLGSTGLVAWAFAEDLDGEVYLLDAAARRIFTLVAVSSEAGVGTFPETLGATGCVDPQDPKKPAAGLIPYDLRSPLWSDGAAKERFLALPDGAQIHVNGDGDFDLPVGTVLMKTFSLAGKRVETRLFMRHPDGEWGGYAYEWNDAQTDAVLLPSSVTKTVDGTSWYIPSRQDCLFCHSAAAGRSLGLEIGQLNIPYTYPNGATDNQLATFDAIDLFDAPLPGPPSSLEALPIPAAAGPVEGRARSYLHSNCSNCHRPGGVALGGMDLRYRTAFVDTNTCDVVPQNGDLGVVGARFIVPGDPSKSIVSLRTHATDVNRMPPIARLRVDPTGTSVLDSWIQSLTACP